MVSGCYILSVFVWAEGRCGTLCHMMHSLSLLAVWPQPQPGRHAGAEHDAPGNAGEFPTKTCS